MLYVTTRSNQDVYTANRALCEGTAPDGGGYVPFKMPRFSPEEVAALAEKSFGQRVAEILNLLFGSRLTGWDVEFAVGRYPVRLASTTHRIDIAEMWHNPGNEFHWMAEKLIRMLRPEADGASEWANLAVQTGVLFGIFGELPGTADIVVPGDDLSAAMAARYARDWGLPVGNIVVCCREDSALWELVHRGELRPGGEAPQGLERLLHACGGTGEVLRYQDAQARETVYAPADAVLSRMREGLHCSVVGGKRIRETIPNVYKSTSYLCGPDTALCYSGLQDCRAVTGESRPAVILAQRSPACDLSAVAFAMGVGEEQLKKILE